MKRLAYMAAALLALSACNNKTAERAETAETHLAQSRDSLQQMLADQDSLLVLMTEITEGMNEIKSLENIMSTPTMGKETIDKRQQIRDDMTVIQKTLLDRRQRLEELENRLNKSNNNNANLKQAIAALREQISGQQTTIESLRKDLASANIYIDELTQNVDSLNSTIVNAIE